MRAFWQNLEELPPVNNFAELVASSDLFHPFHFFSFSSFNLHLRKWWFNSTIISMETNQTIPSKQAPDQIIFKDERTDFCTFLMIISFFLVLPFLSFIFGLSSSTLSATLVSFFFHCLFGWVYCFVISFFCDIR
jgi:hypothetical protein